MNKFEQVDVLDALQKIMKQHTAFYQSDFDIDKSILRRVALSDSKEDKTYLWMSRPSGTHCLRERDVLLKGTYQHNTFCFYAEQTTDKVLAYAVTLTGTEGSKLIGNLYELDYREHVRHVQQEALQADTVTLHYEYGERQQPAKQFIMTVFSGSSSGTRYSQTTLTRCMTFCSRKSANIMSFPKEICKAIFKRCGTARLRMKPKELRTLFKSWVRRTAPTKRILWWSCPRILWRWRQARSRIGFSPCCRINPCVCPA